MKIVDKKITEATENELFIYYLKTGYDDFYSFTDYLDNIKKCGVKVITEMEVVK